MSYPKQYQLRTASNRIVEVTSISTNDTHPIRGFIKDSAPGIDSLCQWDETGYPHNLPYTHGLNLIPYRSKTVYEKITKDQLESAESQWDIDSLDLP